MRTACGMDEDTPPSILRIRRLTSRGLVAFLALINAVSIILAYFSGKGFLVCVVTGGGLFLAVAQAAYRNPTAAATRTLVACCLAIALMLLIFSASPFGDGATQMAHMMYFVTNTFLLAYMCWRSLLIYNVIVVIHHVTLAIFAPQFVWYDSSPERSYINLAIHASIAITQVIPLMFISRYLLAGELATVASLDEAHSAVARADASLLEANAAKARADSSLQEARAAVGRADAALAEQMRLETESRGVREQVLASVRGRLTQAFAEILGSVRSATITVEDGAEALFVSSQDVNHSTTEMLNGAREISVTLTTVANAAHELAISVSEISQRAADAASHSSEAADVVDDASATIAILSKASNEIQGATKLINDIATRTRLLSLNATIEAARSGELGKGFAVVANEVKELAGQTSEATKVISALVESMASETSRTVEAMATIRQSISASDILVSAIAVATSQQRSSTNEIANNALMAASISEAATEKLKMVQSAISAVIDKREMLTKAAARLTSNVDKVSLEVTQLADTLAA